MQLSLNSVTDFKVFDLPVGAAVVGAGLGGLSDAVTGVVNGVAPQVPSWAVKAGLAFATWKYGSKLVGKDAANIGALFMSYDAVQALIPIRTQVANFTAGILSKLPLPTLPAPAPYKATVKTTVTSSSPF